MSNRIIFGDSDQLYARICKKKKFVLEIAIDTAE